MVRQGEHERGMITLTLSGGEDNDGTVTLLTVTHDNDTDDKTYGG